MRHPNQSTLALHAGGDLGPWRRWNTARHLAQCADCREEVARYDDMRELLPELAELPDISWNRLAAEIKANVRLGLEAGECVRTVEMPVHGGTAFAFWRATVAFGSVAVLVLGCLVLERPTPMLIRAEAAMAQSTSKGIQVTQPGGQVLGLTNGGAQKVTYNMDAQGSVGARYTDPETGYVTINTVYAQ